MKPVVAACSAILPGEEDFRLHLENAGFGAVEWTFSESVYPDDTARIERFAAALREAGELPVRYHAKFPTYELGHRDAEFAGKSLEFLKGFVDFISTLRGSFITAHFGLGFDERELDVPTACTNLRELARHGREKGVTVCLENLFTRPTADLGVFEKILEETGMPGVLDIGHVRTYCDDGSADRKIIDFLRKMKGKIAGAHLYQDEINSGHKPLASLDSNKEVLEALIEADCSWWVAELHKLEYALKSKAVIDEFAALRSKTAGK